MLTQETNEPDLPFKEIWDKSCPKGNSTPTGILRTVAIKPDFMQANEKQANSTD